MKKNNLESDRDISWKNLRQAGIPVPFHLTLGDNLDGLYCEQIIRHIPGKRLVAFGTWGEKNIVAKIFFAPRKAKRHFQSEVLGIEALITSKIPTPALLWQGALQKNKIYILIFERIIDGVNLDAIWQEKSSLEALTPLMRAVTIELATQHVLGIVQNDLHLKNFLITKKQIYTLDGSSINHIDEILPKEESLSHLALFFAQLGVGTEKLQEDLFQNYIKARAWLVKKSDVDFLRKETLRWTEKRWAHFEKKIQRNSTDYARIQHFNAVIMYERDYQSVELRHFLSNPEIIFQQPDTQILKAGRSSTVIKIRLDNRDFVVKRYNIKNTWHALRRCLRPSRAATSWNVAQRLRLFGIHTAKPVAYIEKRFLGLRGTSYFLMEFVSGPHIGEYFSDYRGQEELRFTQVAELSLMLLTNLAKLYLTHGDLKMTNILIHHQYPVIIDLDGMVEHRTLLGLRSAFKKEMKRFMKNWENSPSVRALFEKLIGSTPKK